MCKPLADKSQTGAERFERLAGAFENAWKIYGAGEFAAAKRLFGAIAEEFPGDGPSRIYEERCEGAAGAANEAGACTRKTLDAFALTVGKRRQVEGLPAAFRLCVGEDDASGCG